MELYGHRVSPYVERVLLLLSIKGIADQVILKGAPGGDLKGEAYLAINPIGKIPTLVDGDLNLPESQVICEYLEAKFPQTPLWPGDAAGKARASLIARLVDTYFFPAFTPLFSQMDPRARDADVVAKAVTETGVALGYIEHYLGSGTRAVGDDWSIADCALITATFFANMMQDTFGADAYDGHPKLKAWHDHVSTTELVQESRRGQSRALKEFIAMRRGT